MARKSRKGFASLDLERQQEVTRRGGQTGQHLGKGHTFIHEEARRGGERGLPEPLFGGSYCFRALLEHLNRKLNRILDLSLCI